MTHMFDFTVVKFVEDPIKNEPINIGVLVNDNSNKCFGRLVDLKDLNKNKNILNYKFMYNFFSNIGGNSEPKDLKTWVKKFQYQLQFTKPSAIKFDDIEKASEYLFGMYVTSPKPITPQSQSDRKKLSNRVNDTINKTLLESKIAKLRHKIIGHDGISMTIDSHFEDAKSKDIVHCLSFLDSVATTTNDVFVKVKVFDKIKEKYKNLKAHMFVTPPLDSASDEILEQYRYSCGILNDVDWKTYNDQNIEKNMYEIQKPYIVNSSTIKP